MPNVLSSRFSWDYLSTLVLRRGVDREHELIRPFSFVTVSLRTLTISLVLVDLLFITMNLVASAAAREHLILQVPDFLRVTRDNSLPEDFNYIKWGVISVALIWMSIRDRWLAPFLWAVIFALLLFDDSLQLHERLGHELAVRADLPSYQMLAGDDVGELLVFALLGGIVLALTTFLLTRKGADIRLLSLRYLVVILALGFFGVGLDAMHQVVAHFVEGTFVDTVLPQILGVAEDGGEMIVGSIAMAVTLAADPLQHTAPDTANG